MKTVKQLIYVVIASMSIMFSCDDNPYETFEEYSPTAIDPQQAGMLSYTDTTSFPVQEVITLPVPLDEIDRSHAFVLDTVKAAEQAASILNLFSVDNNTGVIEFDNSAGQLLPGDYVISVGVTSGDGVAVFEDVVTVTVLDVPVDLKVTNKTVNVGALEVGTMSNFSVVDNSDGSLSSAVISISSDFDSEVQLNSSTGDVDKIAAILGSPTFKVSATVATNLGTKVFNDVMTVTVGTAPTLNYVQQDGTTDLANVKVSPWSSYTSHTPVLEGMTAASFDLTLPAELSAHSSDITISATGQISIAADASLPEGSFSIGVIAKTAADIEAPFDNAFSLQVEKIVESVINDQLNEDVNDAADPEVAYPGLWQGYANGSGARFVKKNGANGHYGFRIFKPHVTAADASLTRLIDVTGYKTVDVTFGEILNNSNSLKFWEHYYREWFFGDNNTDISGGTFSAGNWNAILDKDHADWVDSNASWDGATNEYSTSIDVSQLSGTDLYLHWRITPLNPSSAEVNNGQYWIDYVVVSGAKAYTAIEE